MNMKRFPVKLFSAILAVGVFSFSPARGSEDYIPALEAEEWLEAGFNLDTALQWRQAGFKEPAAAASWRGSGLSSQDAFQANFLGLSPEELKGWKNGVPVTLAAIARDNKMAPKDFIKKLAAAGKSIKNADLLEFEDLKSMNPFEAEGKFFSLEVERFQLLGKSSGLYSVLDDPEQRLHVDFAGRIAPNQYALLILKGKKPFSYNSAGNAYSIVPSFSAIFECKIEAETWARLRLLQVAESE